MLTILTVQGIFLEWPTIMKSKFQPEPGYTRKVQEVFQTTTMIAEIEQSNHPLTRSMESQYAIEDWEREQVNPQKKDWTKDKAKVVASDWMTESLPRQLFCLGLFETNG